MCSILLYLHLSFLSFFFSPNRKFYYITLLRDPVSRYLSEWRHVQRGATWKTSLHMCDGRTPTPEELPSCYEGSDWSGCTLQQFMDCPYNLANNRQVRRRFERTQGGRVIFTELNKTSVIQLCLCASPVSLQTSAADSSPDTGIYYC